MKNITLSLILSYAAAKSHHSSKNQNTLTPTNTKVMA